MNTYQEVVLRISNSDQELIEFSLFENGALGIEEIKEENNKKEVKVFFESIDQETIQSQLQRIQNEYSLETAIDLVSLNNKPVENWQENWKSHFKPIEIGSSFRIIPPWESPNENKNNIIINPGMGFGTGYHESTNLALQMLDEIDELSKKSIFDFGTGSGILAIAAALKYDSKVFGVDIEKEAIEEAKDNAKLSQVETNCSFSTQLIQENTESFDGVIANIIAEVILEFKAEILNKAKSWILLSGIHVDRKEELEENFRELKLMKKKEEGEWSSYLYLR